MQAWTETASRTVVWRNTAGFTLVEILIVITIIALLAALVGPRLMGSLSKSQGKTTKAQIEMMATALDNFRLDNGRYPTEEEGLRALIEAPDGLAAWAGPYLKKRQLPRDAWGFEFQYSRPPQRGGIDFDLYSLGADGAEGGEGENAEIGNWQ
jgi:general secretion pathway protein G